MKQFKKYLADRAGLAERGRKKHLKQIKNAPQIIVDALAYSLNAGGKRVRPILVMAAAEAFGLKPADAIPAASAVEMLHTYSLIHDDLPSMDNDDLRRGKPTNHKVFGEDLALLAGDALLTYAFQTVLKNGEVKTVGYEKAAKAAYALAYYGGVSGMIGGQVADVYAEGILEGKSKRASLLTASKYFKGKSPKYFLLPGEAKEVSAPALLTYIHKNKTGALITAAVEMGAILAGAEASDLKNMRKYAGAIGFAFQVVDDILDVTATKKQLGKSNSDAQNKKLTYVTLYGLEESKKAALKALKDAQNALNALKTAKKDKLKPLYDMAEFIVGRSY